MKGQLLRSIILLSTAQSFSILPVSSRRIPQLYSVPPLLDVRVVSSMPEPLPLELKNEYYLFRHGQSTANVASVISSARSLAYSTKHGLTDLGYQQGFEAAEQLTSLLKESKKRNVVFVSSPFARALQTAQACIDGLSTMDTTSFDIDPTIHIRDNLMERYFGRLDDEAIYTYAYVWPLDKFNVTHTAFDVESVAAVATRLREVILSLEDEWDQTNVILVSHADVLQICQLYATQIENVGTFSSYRFANGEIRKMARTIDSLPIPSPLSAPERDTKAKMK